MYWESIQSFEVDGGGLEWDVGSRRVLTKTDRLGFDSSNTETSGIRPRSPYAPERLKMYKSQIYYPEMDGVPTRPSGAIVKIHWNLLAHLVDGAVPSRAPSSRVGLYASHAVAVVASNGRRDCHR